MKKTLLLLHLLVTSLLVASAADLPFVPTTNPSSSSTYWYKLRTGSIYAYATSDYFPELMGSTSSSDTDNYLWCFVGDAASGYKVYNRAAKRYLVSTQLGSDDESQLALYEEAGNGTFYLSYSMNMSGFYDKYYVTWNTSYDQFVADVIKGTPWTCEEAIKGTEEKNWTRYDGAGIGYRYLSGGTGPFSNENTPNLIDGSAKTKFYGPVDQCWFTMEASNPVAVDTYSIVTAADSRTYPGRALRSWTLYGSNDNANWIEIDSRTDYPMPLASLYEVVIPVKSADKYTYFKFQCTAGAENNVQLSEVWINRHDHRNDYNSYMEPACGQAGFRYKQCGLCWVQVHERIEPTGEHSYSGDTCSVCKTKKGETLLLDHGQDLPYTARFLHGFRNSNQTWPNIPADWTTTVFDDSKWAEAKFPIASPGHTNGPFSPLFYSSQWYGEYNYYLIRRPFRIENYDPELKYILRTVHDDNIKVYVNGIQVYSEEGWTSMPEGGEWSDSYQSIELPAEPFRQGDNVLAIYIQQNWGGAYFDCSLVTQEPEKVIVAGDINGDAKVDVDDINAIINIVTGKKPASDYPGKADVTDDGTVDVGDINKLLNMILGKDTPGETFVEPPTTEHTVNGVTFKMIGVQGGTYTMGATEEQSPWAFNNEKPAHRVTLSSFNIGETEVTQALWNAVMGENPSYIKGDNNPVETVTWDMCQTFIEKLNELTGLKFRLPTEAEWEYAARGGVKSKGYVYSGSNNIDDVAWVTSNCGKKHKPVAQKLPNELGIYDMSGNVSEWCHDYNGLYSEVPQVNPVGPAEAPTRMQRGGHYWYEAIQARVSARAADMRNRATIWAGLRLAY